jgi:hypothetical protein
MAGFNYCTLFNYNYLSRGLVLYDSLCEVQDDFCLYIFAFDDKTKDYLNSLKLTQAVIIGMNEFEDAELLKVKPTRTFSEYCWTCTPSVIKYAIDKYNLDSCTYLDADLYFYASPGAIFNELSDSSIGLTPHNYSREYDKSIMSGKYCVQFVFFKNDQNGMEALSWWRNECIKWCYARVEKGKFGDQKYLDSFNSLFHKLHVIENPGSGIAPWNILQYKFQYVDNMIVGITFRNDEFPIVFYHFHKLEINHGEKVIRLRKYNYSENVLNTFYVPYIKKLLAFDSGFHKTSYKIEDFKFIVPNKLELKYIRFIGKIGEWMFIRRLFNFIVKSK